MSRLYTTRPVMHLGACDVLLRAQSFESWFNALSVFRFRFYWIVSLIQTCLYIILWRCKRGSSKRVLRMLIARELESPEGMVKVQSASITLRYCLTFTYETQYEGHTTQDQEFKYILSRLAERQRCSLEVNEPRCSGRALSDSSKCSFGPEIYPILPWLTNL
jgi:hypothetical protein